MIAAGIAIMCSGNTTQPASEYAIDLRAGVGVATNPFVVPGGKIRTFANFEVAPEWRLSTETAITTIRGLLSTDVYIGDEPRVSLSGVAERDERLSERLSYNAVIALDASEGSRTAIPLIDPTAPPALSVGPPQFNLDIPDPDQLAGGDMQRYLARGATLFRYRLSQRDHVEAGVNAERAVYPNQTLYSDFNSFGARAGYERALNERTSAGVRLNTQWVHSEDTLGRVRIITPQVTARYRLSEIWTVDGAVGGLFVSSKSGFRPPDESTSLSGSLRACRRSPAAEFCASMLRDAAISGLSGLVHRTAADAYYARIIDRDTRVQATLLYGKFAQISRISAPIGLGDRQYVGMSGSIERRLGERLFATVSAVAERANYEALGSATNVRAQFSIGYRLGDQNYGRPRSDR